jgi:DhnA family fructose-bisphosphate aldolase class Ia
LLGKVSLGLRCGATGLIFGRNMWQRPMEEALALTARIRALMTSE